MQPTKKRGISDEQISMRIDELISERNSLKKVRTLSNKLLTKQGKDVVPASDKEIELRNEIILLKARLRFRKKTQQKKDLTKEEYIPEIGVVIKSNLLVKLLTRNAKLPVTHAINSGIYDIFSSELCDIPPHGINIIKTNIAVKIPQGYYGRIESLMNVKFLIRSTLIDNNDYYEIVVAMENISTKKITVNSGDIVGMLTIHSCKHINIVEQPNGSL